MKRVASLPFLVGRRPLLPASGSGMPDNTISGRAGTGLTVSVPDWTSTRGRISIQFSDHLQNARRSDHLSVLASPCRCEDQK
ncbi:MAG TPA: hypothetical protein VF152_15465 [Acidimicrobiia bacterium]